MNAIAASRRALAAAAIGSTGVALTGGALAGILLTEAKLARRWVGVPTTVPPDDNGYYGFCPGEAISFAVLGDSSAAGLGVDRPEQTPGARIACGLAAAAELPVRLTNVALVGARSADLDRQVTVALEADPDVALIMVGANDITHRVALTAAVSYLDLAVRRLRAAGCEVIVATCPDLGTIEPIAQPLRYLARRWSRQLAAAQTIVVVEAGGRTVSLGDLIGPEFSAAPHEMFSPDRFHPSAAGYAQAAMAVLPSVCAAMGYWPSGETAPDPSREEGLMPVAFAAVEAAERPGTEVAPAEAHERAGGLRAAAGMLRHRRRTQLEAPNAARASAA
ncbi:MAG TPA: SGNH/GDSL hydrolase family protein [Sporichthyaceae bacterium]|nr:SGNH/GDSL hydrolase family protein [Sporichthyaceae bacterium]